MKRISLLIVLLLCFSFAGCSYDTAPQEPPITSEKTPETPSAPPLVTPGEPSASAVPDGLVKNEAGATDAEVSAIFAVEKRGYDIESVAGQGIYLYIYARQDWHGGALLLAGISLIGQVAPELYFVSDGEMIMYTAGSDIWSINYTHYQGDTIVFGKSFAWDGEPLATDEVIAEFWNGEAVTVPMRYTPNGEEDIPCGYICVAPATTWLKSLEIAADGKTVADDGHDQFLADPSSQPWYGEAESIRNRTRYVWTSDAWPGEKPHAVDYFGGTPTVTLETPYEGERTLPSSLEYWPACPAHEGISPDIWHSNNGTHDRVDVIAGSRITAEVIAVGANFDPSRKVSDLAVSEVYWVDLSVPDDEKCISEGELVCPAEKGFYVLVVVTDYGYFSQMLRVV